MDMTICEGLAIPCAALRTDQCDQLAALLHPLAPARGLHGGLWLVT